MHWWAYSVEASIGIERVQQLEAQHRLYRFRQGEGLDQLINAFQRQKESEATDDEMEAGAGCRAGGVLLLEPGRDDALLAQQHIFHALPAALRRHRPGGGRCRNPPPAERSITCGKLLCLIACIVTVVTIRLRFSRFRSSFRLAGVKKLKLY